MNRSELLALVQEQLRDIVEEDDLLVTEATTADDVTEWDSTNHVRLIVALESALGIRFDTDEISTPSNVGELIDLLQRKTGKT